MIQIDGRLCTACSACVEACPSGAIAVRAGTAWVAADGCDGCGVCVNACPQDAILLVDVLAPPSPVGQLTVRHPRQQIDDLLAAYEATPRPVDKGRGQI